MLSSNNFVYSRSYSASYCLRNYVVKVKFMVNRFRLKDKPTFLETVL